MEKKYTFNMWLTLLKFKNHTVHSTLNSYFGDLITISNSKGEWIKLKIEDYKTIMGLKRMEQPSSEDIY